MAPRLNKLDKLEGMTCGTVALDRAHSESGEPDDISVRINFRSCNHDIEEGSVRAATRCARLGSFGKHGPGGHTES